MHGFQQRHALRCTTQYISGNSAAHNEMGGNRLRRLLGRGPGLQRARSPGSCTACGRSGSSTPTAFRRLGGCKSKLGPQLRCKIGGRVRGARIHPALIPVCIRHGGGMGAWPQPACDCRRRRLLPPLGVQARESKMDFLVLHAIGVSIPCVSAGESTTIDIHLLRWVWLRFAQRGCVFLCHLRLCTAAPTPRPRAAPRPIDRQPPSIPFPFPPRQPGAPHTPPASLCGRRPRWLPARRA